MQQRAKKAKKKSSKQVAFTRFMLIVAVLVIWIGGISARLVHLQVQHHDWFSDRASRQRQDIKKSKMLRGTIYDRNGRVLAMSVNVKTLYADATEIHDLKGTAKKVAKLFNVNETKLLAQLTDAKQSERRFVPLAKGLDDESVQRINKSLEDPTIKKAGTPRFTGLHWREDQKRSYPYQSLAAHVVGFSNAEGVGQAGIEQSQNEILYGAVIKKTQERDRLGRVYDETISEKEPPKDIVLTIDTAVQYQTEQALEKAAVAAQVKSASAIVIDQKTGEILAMANYPTFDPNKFNEIDAENLKNFSIQSMYSPGSVFKLITYGAALENKLITPEAIIDTGGGSIQVGKRRFADGHPVGAVTYSKAMAQSSNVAAIKTSLRVGKENYYASILNMGFGKATGIELPAETKGVVRSPDRWYGDSLPSMSIGYEIGVSALQMTTAFATIANNGVRVQPHIIKEIRQSGEQEATVTKPEQKQVVSPETARGLTAMLREVVVSGTGKRAQLHGYSSAGKTGTAWKFDEKLKRVNAAKYISSFIGFAPAENPQITIGVVMDEPQVGGRNGGQVSAPVFQEVADQYLADRKIPRDMDVDVDSLTAEEIPESIGNGEELEADDSAAAETEREPAPKPVASLTQKTASVKPTSANAGVVKAKPSESKIRVPEKPPAKREPKTVEPKGRAQSRPPTEKTRQKT